MYMYGISNKDWLRIRQNLDSKCRTAFRRKLKGMPLTTKGCRSRLANNSVENTSLGMTLNNTESSSSDIGLSGDQHGVASKPTSEELQYMDQDIQQILPIKLEASGCAVTFSDSHTQIIHTEHGDIQVIQATEEQLEQLKHSHHIEILSHADVLPEQVLESAN
nr:protein BANP-like [Parasteatoda tepidariorum]